MRKNKICRFLGFGLSQKKFSRGVKRFGPKVMKRIKNWIGVCKKIINKRRMIKRIRPRLKKRFKLTLKRRKKNWFKLRLKKTDNCS